MKKITYLFSFFVAITLVSSINSCQEPCINEVFLETLEMNFEVNSENLGILSGAVRNSGDTIKSVTNQFYNNPDFRRTGQLKLPKVPSFISTAYAAGDCPEKIEYVSRMDLDETKFSINVDYDGTALGIGVIPADSNLLAIPELRNGYLAEFDTNIFIAAGAKGPLTIQPEFFGPINNQPVIFSFYFEEKNGTAFFDEAEAYIKVSL